MSDDPGCPWCDEIDAEAEDAATRAEAVEQLASKARASDEVAIAAVRDLLTIPTLPVAERMALESALADQIADPWSVTVEPDADDSSAVKVRIEMPLWLAPPELWPEHK